MPSVLGSAVFQMTASTAGLAFGLNRALGMVTTGLARISKRAMDSDNLLVKGLGILGMGATVASQAINLLITSLAALSSTVVYAGNTFDALHNIQQTFGTHTRTLTDTIKEQSQAFGVSRQELMSYADTVGRQLQALGVDMKDSADVADLMTKAIGRLVIARNVTPEKAFAQLQSGAMLFDKDQVRVAAYKMGLLHLQNEELTKGNELLVEYYLSAREVLDTTDNITEAGRNFNDQLDLTVNTFREMADAIGNDLEPTFLRILDAIRSWTPAIKQFLEAFSVGMGVISGTAQETVGRIAVGRAGLEPAVGQQIDTRNQLRAAQNRQEQLQGQVMRHMSGGMFGGFKTSFAGYHDRLQEIAWQANQLNVLKAQLDHQKAVVTQLQILNRRFAPPGGNPVKPGP